MQTYDAAMLAVMAAAILFGAWKGLAWQVASLGAIFLSYFTAYRFRHDAAAALGINPILAMLVLYVGTSIAVWLAFRLVRRGIDGMRLRDFDRQTGAILGAFKGLVLCVIVTLFGVTLLGEQQKDAICRSYSGAAISQLVDYLDAVMPDEVQAVVKPYLDRLDDELERGVAAPSGDPYANDPPGPTPAFVPQPAAPPRNDFGGAPSAPAPGPSDLERFRKTLQDFEQSARSIREATERLGER